MRSWIGIICICVICMGTGLVIGSVCTGRYFDKHSREQQQRIAELESAAKEQYRDIATTVGELQNINGEFDRVITSDASTITALRSKIKDIEVLFNRYRNLADRYIGLYRTE